MLVQREAVSARQEPRPPDTIKTAARLKVSTWIKGLNMDQRSQHGNRRKPDPHEIISCHRKAQIWQTEVVASNRHCRYRIIGLHPSDSHDSWYTLDL